ncbi:hypothetical protein B0H13DRAFT_2377045 [Mycena leptocephala]|nr:hypothetical protein B0H13DRAFT_2377045 [Mycena leptocephala]
MPKVKDVSIWLCWAVDPASALRVLLLRLLLALSMHFLLPLLRPYLPLSLQRLSPAVVHPELVKTTQLCLKAPGDLALLAYSVVLFSFLRLMLSHTLFTMLVQRWGIRKAGKLARFGEQGCAVVYFAAVPSPPPSLPPSLVPPSILLPSSSLLPSFLPPSLLLSPFFLTLRSCPSLHLPSFV